MFQSDLHYLQYKSIDIVDSVRIPIPEYNSSVSAKLTYHLLGPLCTMATHLQDAFVLLTLQTDFVCKQNLPMVPSRRWNLSNTEKLLTTN